jgi:hypothetical protein
MLGPPPPGPPPPGPPRPPAGRVTGPGNVTIHAIRGEFVYTSAKIVGNWRRLDEGILHFFPLHFGLYRECI